MPIRGWRAVADLGELEHFDPAARCTVRRVQLARCSVMYPIVGPAIFEDVTIDRLDTERQPLFVRGSLRSSMSRSREMSERSKFNPARIQCRWNASIEPSWKQTWNTTRTLMVLDIREVRAKELSIESVPVDLVRYDPEHQAVVRLTKIRKRWSEIKKECRFGVCLRDARSSGGRRDVIPFHNWTKVESWNNQVSGLFAWGEMGMLNYHIHSMTQRGESKLPCRTCSTSGGITEKKNSCKTVAAPAGISLKRSTSANRALLRAQAIFV